MKNNFYKGKKVLVTGANGFKGVWLSMWLKELGASVYGLGLKKDDNFFSKNINIRKLVKFYDLDITNFNSFNKFIVKIKPQIVFHLAGQPLVFNSYLDPKRTFEINSNGTLNVLEACNRLSVVRSLVCITSDKSYKNLNLNTPYKETDELKGDDPYSASKSCADIIINSYQKTLKRKKLGISAARAGNVIGGGDFSNNRIIPDIVKSIFLKKKIVLRNPGATRPWQHVLDPLNGYLILGEKNYDNPSKFSEAFNFGPKKIPNMSVLMVCKQFLKFSCSKIKITVKFNRIKEHGKLLLNIKKSEKILKWKPIYSVNVSIKKTSNWYMAVMRNKRKTFSVTRSQLKEFANKTNYKML